MHTYRCARLLFAIFALSVATHAAPVVFTIDPAQSQITIAANIAGSEFQKQAGGGDSLTTKFGVPIKAEVTDSSIQFTGGSMVDAKSMELATRRGRRGGSAPAFAGRPVRLLWRKERFAM
jgi:hypothetical protein